MYVLRPVREEDLEGVLALSRETSHGLTTLPFDATILGRRIRNSIASFERLGSEPIAGDEYFLVLEDVSTGELVGTSAVVSKVGGFEPFYAYRVETAVHESKALGVRKEIRTLHLVAEHNGPSEIGTLFLSPRARRAGTGRLLSLGRFLLIAEHPHAFDETIIAEMRGVIDEDGRSPFWESLGRHFFDVDLPTADYKSVEDKSIIADLMPTHPIYVPLLSEEAQAVIGAVHVLTEPAVHLLEAEGFRDAGMVDIFEAGRVIECPRDEIRAIRESRVAPVVSLCRPESTDAGASADPGADTPLYLISNPRSFRMGVGSLTEEDAGVVIEATLASALEVATGDEIRFTPLRPDQTKKAAVPRDGR